MHVDEETWLKFHACDAVPQDPGWHGALTSTRARVLIRCNGDEPETLRVVLQEGGAITIEAVSTQYDEASTIENFNENSDDEGEEWASQWTEEEAYNGVRHVTNETWEPMTFDHTVGLFTANMNAALIALPATRLDRCRYVQVGGGESQINGGSGWGNRLDSIDSFTTLATRPVTRYYSQVRSRVSTRPLALTPHEVYFFEPLCVKNRCQCGRDSRACLCRFSPGDHVRITSGKHKGEVKVFERASDSGKTFYFTDGEKMQYNASNKYGFDFPLRKVGWTVLRRSLFASRIPSVEGDDGIYLNNSKGAFMGMEQYQLAPGA